MVGGCSACSVLVDPKLHKKEMLDVHIHTFQGQGIYKGDH